MALYYFHLRDGEDRLLDPEGREIAAEALIPGIALKEARSIISQDALGGSIKLGQWIEVHDAGDKVVHRLAFQDAVVLHQ